MGILITDSLVVNATGITVTNSYCSFGKSTVKIKRDINPNVIDPHIYVAHGIARLYNSIQDRKDNKDPVKQYFINLPDVDISQVNDNNLYTLLYDKLKLESDFSGKNILDIPTIGVTTSSASNVNIVSGITISDSLNQNLIRTFDYSVDNGISTILNENPEISFTELHLAPDFLGLSETNLKLDVISQGISTSARIISDNAITLGITNRNIVVNLKAKNPQLSVTYNYVINPE